MTNTTTGMTRAGKHFSACIFILALLAGCASQQPYINLFLEGTDGPGTLEYLEAGKLLSGAYFEGQGQGEGLEGAARKYGPGVREFYGVYAYRLTASGHMAGRPCLRYRVQATNQMGGIVWDTYDLLFAYHEDLDRGGDKYKGLRIFWIRQVF